MSGRKPRITSIDVARAAGVSQSAVSRAFSPGTHVSKRTREKVLRAAEALGYTPNAIARSLISRRSNLIAIVMADMTNPFYPEVLERLTRAFQEQGQRTLLFNVGHGQDVDAILPRVFEYQADGIVITSALLSSETAEACARRGTPVVLFNRYVRDAAVNSVCCDNVEGGRLVANLLADAGHRRLGYVAGVENTSTNRDRERGFFDRLEERGLPPPARAQGHYRYEGGFAAAHALLDAAEPPDAIFCANDIMALGALDAARARGVPVPDALSVVGFDDIPAAAWPGFALTTVRQRIDVMVEESLAILMSQIEGRSTGPAFRLIAGELVVRASARLPGGAGGR